MKLIQSTLFRALCGLIAGALLLYYDNEMYRWVTILLGVMFFVSGVISCIVYLGMRHNANKAKKAAETEETEMDVTKPSFTLPIVGAGSIILGGLLALIPENFSAYLLYIFLSLLILGALMQMFYLAMSLKMGRLHWAFWVLPVVILLVGIISLLMSKDLEHGNTIAGITMLLYGISECMIGIALHRMRKAYINLQAKGTEIAKAEATDSPSADAIEVE